LITFSSYLPPFFQDYFGLDGAAIIETKVWGYTSVNGFNFLRLPTGVRKRNTQVQKIKETLKKRSLKKTIVTDFMWTSGTEFKYSYEILKAIKTSQFHQDFIILLRNDMDRHRFNISAVSAFRIDCEKFNPKIQVTEDLYINREYNLAAWKTFSPNGDDINDMWLPEHLNYLNGEFSLIVADINGKVVFQTASTDKKWDGSIMGSSEFANKGETYAWTATYVDNNGENRMAKGAITLTEEMLKVTEEILKEKMVLIKEEKATAIKNQNYEVAGKIREREIELIKKLERLKTR